MYLRKGLRVMIILWVTLELFGCAWFQTKEEKTAKELAEEGAHLGILPVERYAHALAMVSLLEWFLGEEKEKLMEECNVCHGSGNVACPGCEAWWEQRIRSLHTETTIFRSGCARCNSTGRVTCPACRGNIE